MMVIFLAAVAEDEAAGLQVDVLRVVVDEPLGVAVLQVEVHGHVGQGAGGGGGHCLEGGPGRLGGGGPRGGPRGGPGGGPLLLLRGPLPDHHPPRILRLYNSFCFERLSLIYLKTGWSSFPK